MEERKLDYEGASIFYKVAGNGTPVVLLHGFGEDSQIWDTTVNDLQTEYRLIIPDLPGSGRSTGNIEGITTEKLAEYVRAVADHEKLVDFSLIGHSMGGYITLAFADKYPERLSRFGLFHSSAFADNEEKLETRKKNIEFIRKNGSAKFLEQSVPNLFSESFSNDHPQVVRDMIARYSNFPADSLVYYTQAMMKRPDRTNVLKSFSKPVLFIMGEYDTAIPLEQGLKQCSIPEFSYIYIGAHSGHMGMLEEPGFCLKAMKDFLAGL